MNRRYIQIPHTADLKIRVFGASVEELFKNCMIGMFSVIKPHGPAISYIKEDGEEDKLNIAKFSSEHKINLRSQNIEILLVDFLSECLYLSDTHDEAYFDVTFKILTNTELECEVFGVKIDRFELVEIKAVTYHDLSVEENMGQWLADLVFDI